MRNDSLNSVCQFHLKFIVVNLISLIFGLSPSKEESGKSKKRAQESPLNEFINSMKLDDGNLYRITNYLDYLVVELRAE